MRRLGTGVECCLEPGWPTLAVARGDGFVRLHDGTDGSLARFGTPAHDLPVDLAFSPNGHRLATATEQTGVTLWEIPSGREVLRLSHSITISAAVAFRPGGELLATADRDGAVRLWPGKRTTQPGGQRLFQGPGDVEIQMTIPEVDQQGGVGERIATARSRGPAASPEGHRNQAIADRTLTACVLYLDSSFFAASPAASRTRSSGSFSASSFKRRNDFGRGGRRDFSQARGGFDANQFLLVVQCFDQQRHGLRFQLWVAGADLQQRPDKGRAGRAIQFLQPLFQCRHCICGPCADLAERIAGAAAHFLVVRIQRLDQDRHGVLGLRPDSGQSELSPVAKQPIVVTRGRLAEGFNQSLGPPVPLAAPGGKSGAAAK